MSTMNSNTSLMAAKPDQLAHHPLRRSKTNPSLDDFQDFDDQYYHQPTTTTSPRIRVYHDANFIGSSEPVDFRVLFMDNVAAVQQNAQIKQESGREKLEKHWTEVTGRVCIPDKWGQENFLQDWMDSSLFDSLLAPKGLASAREALVAERRRENSRCLKMADQNGEQVLSFLT